MRAAGYVAIRIVGIAIVMCLQICGECRPGSHHKHEHCQFHRAEKAHVVSHNAVENERSVV
jgi:hypothetical protein